MYSLNHITQMTLKRSLLHSLKQYFFSYLASKLFNYLFIQIFSSVFSPHTQLAVGKIACVDFSYFYFSCYHLPYEHKLKNFLN